MAGETDNQAQRMERALAGTFAQAQEEIEQGLTGTRYFSVSDRHTANYTELTRGARESGFTKITLLLDTENRDAAKDTRTVLLGAGEVAVVVNAASLQATPELGQKILRQKLEKGIYIELTPALAENYDRLAGAAEQAGHKAARIMLELGNQARPTAEFVPVPGGEPIFRIKSHAHLWTPEFAEKYGTAKRAAVEEGLQKGDIKTPQTAGMPPEVLSYYAESAARRQTPDGKKLEAPEIYVYYKPEGPNVKLPNGLPMSNAGVSATDDGKTIIAISASILGKTLEVQKSVLDHELGHVQLGHTQPAIVAKKRNDELFSEMAFSHAMEKAADKAGICFAPEPAKSARGLISFIDTGYEEALQILMLSRSREESRRSIAEQEKKGDHQTNSDRKREIAHHIEDCAPGLQLTPPKTPANDGRVK